MAVNSEIFVDKSEMIQYLNRVVNTQQRFVSVSRPRRFGKTMAADMVCAYYDRKADSKDLFAKRKLAGCVSHVACEKEIPWDIYLGGFDVIRLVMTKFFKKKLSVADALARDYQAVRDWYDGYEVSDIIPSDPGHEESCSADKTPDAVRYSLYSPLSVVDAMTTGVIKDYWNKTETYEALAEFIEMDYDGLKEAVALLMDGARIVIDTSTYQNDMTTFHGRDDVLSLLVHLGYLGFDDRRSEVFIPNREILDEFRTSTKTEFKHHKCIIEKV